MVMVSSAVMAVLAVAFLSQYRSQAKVTRNLAAQNGIMDFSRALDLQFSIPSCSSNNIYKEAGATAKVKGALATPTLTWDTYTSLSKSNLQQMIQPYSIASVTLTSEGPGFAQGANFAFPFQMTLSFSAQGGAAPPSPLRKFILVLTDASRNVLGSCYRSSNAGCTYVTGNSIGSGYNVTAVAACPAGTVVTGGG